MKETRGGDEVSYATRRGRARDGTHKRVREETPHAGGERRPAKRLADIHGEPRRRTSTCPKHQKSPRLSPGTSKRSVADGDWSNGATWSSGCWLRRTPRECVEAATAYLRRSMCASTQSEPTATKEDERPHNWQSKCVSSLSEALQRATLLYEQELARMRERRGREEQTSSRRSKPTVEPFVRSLAHNGSYRLPLRVCRSRTSRRADVAVNAFAVGVDVLRLRGESLYEAHLIVEEEIGGVTNTAYVPISEWIGATRRVYDVILPTADVVDDADGEIKIAHRADMFEFFKSQFKADAEDKGPKWARDILFDKSLIQVPCRRTPQNKDGIGVEDIFGGEVFGVVAIDATTTKNVKRTDAGENNAESASLLPVRLMCYRTAEILDVSAGTFRQLITWRWHGLLSVNDYIHRLFSLNIRTNRAEYRKLGTVDESVKFALELSQAYIILDICSGSGLSGYHAASRVKEWRRSRGIDIPVIIVCIDTEAKKLTHPCVWNDELAVICQCDVSSQNLISSLSREQRERRVVLGVIGAPECKTFSSGAHAFWARIAQYFGEDAACTLYESRVNDGVTLARDVFDVANYFGCPAYVEHPKGNRCDRSLCDLSHEGTDDNRSKSKPGNSLLSHAARLGAMNWEIHPTSMCKWLPFRKKGDGLNYRKHTILFINVAQKFSGGYIRHECSCGQYQCAGSRKFTASNNPSQSRHKDHVKFDGVPRAVSKLHPPKLVRTIFGQFMKVIENISLVAYSIIDGDAYDRCELVQSQLDDSLCKTNALRSRIRRDAAALTMAGNCILEYSVQNVCNACEKNDDLYHNFCADYVAFQLHLEIWHESGGAIDVESACDDEHSHLLELIESVQQTFERVEHFI